MPYNLVFQIIVFGSLGIAIVILSRAIPRIEDDVLEEKKKIGYLDKWGKKLPLEQIDNLINIFLHKVLRRLRIVIMKADNLVSHKIVTVSKKDKKNRKKSFLP